MVSHSEKVLNDITIYCVIQRMSLCNIRIGVRLFVKYLMIPQLSLSLYLAPKIYIFKKAHGPNKILFSFPTGPLPLDLGLIFNSTLPLPQLLHNILNFLILYTYIEFSFFIIFFFNAIQSDSKL